MRIRFSIYKVIRDDGEVLNYCWTRRGAEKWLRRYVRNLDRLYVGEKFMIEEIIINDEQKNARTIWTFCNRDNLRL